MRLPFLLQFLLVAALVSATDVEDDVNTNDNPATDSDNIEKMPTILVVTLFRNKAHVLPYYFTFLDALDYPKDRIALW